MKRASIFTVTAMATVFAVVGPAAAAMRSGSAGEWHTGEITATAFVGRWGYGTTDQGHVCVVTADESVKQVGDASIKFDTGSGFDAWTYFPNTKDLDLDCTKVGSISFLLHTENKNNWGPDVWVILRDMSDRTATFTTTHNRMPLTLTEWVPYGLPVGPDAQRNAAAFGWKLELEAAFDWEHVGCIETHADTGGYGFVLYLDDMRFNPRGAAPVKWWLSSLDKPDLTVTWAEQLPHYKRYMPNYSNGWPELKPETRNLKRWPDEGESVTYLVHVRNEGFAASKPTDFVCTIDGEVVKRVTLEAIKRKSETIVKVPWKWKQGAYVFLAKVDTANALDEITKRNNFLEFQTDAYQLYAYVEHGCARRVGEICNALGSFSFEDWLRSQTVNSMNAVFEKSKYDFAPNGTRARVRIGKVIYGEKMGKLPLTGSCDEEDGSWEYPERGWIEYCNLAHVFMWALNHELMHQLGVIDDYQMNIGGPTDNLANGKPFGSPDAGMMGGGRTYGHDSSYLADMDVAGLEATYGHRRGYFGDYLYNIPDKNTVQFLVDGQPVRDTEVLVHQLKWEDREGYDQTGNATVTNEIVVRGKTDGEGRYELENRPVRKELTTATGCTLKPNPFGHIDVVGRNGLLLFRLKSGDEWYYEFLDIGRFNVEYARGNTEEAHYRVELKPEKEEEPKKE